MTVPPKPSPHQRVNIKTNIAITPRSAKRQPHRMEPRVIPYNTELRPLIMHPYYGIICNVPLVKRYNTMAIRLKGHNLMANHLEKIPPPIKIWALSPTNTKVHTIVEDLVHTNITTVEVKIQPDQMKAFIFLDTGKSQD